LKGKSRRMKPRIKFETQVLAAFAAAVLMLALLASAAWVVSRQANESARAVAHTHATINRFERAKVAALMMESLTRGYVISGDTSRLPQRLAAIADLETELAQIRSRTSDDAEQRKRWVRLREVADQRIAASDRLLLAHQVEGFEAAQAFFLSVPAREVRERMLQVLGDMEDAEHQLLATRTGEHERVQSFVRVFNLLLALALAALLAATFALIRRQLRATETSRHALAQSEQSLSVTLHSIGDAVLATDTQGRITRMNAVAERLTGWPLVEARGRPVAEAFRIINEKTRAPAEVPIAKVLATGELQGLANHTVLIARDGSECPIADTAAPIRDAEGRVSGVVLVFRDVTLEQQAERSIREQNEELEQRVRERTAQLSDSEERLRLFIDHAPAAIAMFDRDMRYVAVSRRWLADYRLGGQNFIGRSHYEVFPELPERYKDIHRRCLAGAVERADEDSFPRGDGSIDWVRWEVRPWRDAGGEIGGIILFSEVITERWRAQQQQQAEQSVLEGISTGRPLNEVLGLVAQHVEALAPGALCSILLPDSEGQHLRCAAAPSLPEAYNRAIDGQAIGPQASPCGTAAYRNEPVIVTDIATDPLWADYAALALSLGLRACWVTPVRAGSGKVLGTFALYYREPRAPSAADQQLIERWTRLTSIAIERRQHEDELHQLNTGLERRVAERTAELERARQEAERLSRVKDTFLATMSHEIRTPMNALLGMLELIGLYRLEREQAHRIDVAQSAGKSLLRIIDDILDFSRIEAGKLEIRPEPANLAELVELTANFFLPVASSKGLVLSHSVDPRISPALRVDRLRLRQILNNFVSNAIKFTERGEVQIKAELIERRPQADRIRLSVTDTGVGIAAEVQPRLFQPFSQADAETTRRFGGSGLGLAICQRLSEMMGGRIELHSAPGKGTTLNLDLELPHIELAELLAAQAAGRAAQITGASGMLQSPIPSVPEARAAGTLVLLVDDHPTNREVLSEQLHALGYASEQAATSTEALRMWEMAHYGLLISDCHMPDMDGYQLTRAIRRQEAETGRARTPILAWTANALGEVADLCAAAGMDDLLVKPANLNVLRQRLGRWLPVSTLETDEVLDRVALRELTDGDADMEARILKRFVDTHRVDAEALLQSLSDRDGLALAHLAHRIKGAARLIGARELGSACEALEAAGRNNDWASIDASKAAFVHAQTRLERALR